MNLFQIFLPYENIFQPNLNLFNLLNISSTILAMAKCWSISRSLRCDSLCTTCNLGVDFDKLTEEELAKHAGITVLKSSDLNLTNLSFDIGWRFSRLSTLELIKSQITHIDVKTFSNLNKLEDLRLCQNLLSTFDTSTFVNLINLKHLDLSQNEICEIDETLLHNLTKLKHFNCSRNQITTIGKNLFRTNDKLKVLDLSHNEISEIPFQIFEANINLEIINLSNNKIAMLHFTTFKKLSNLENLQLQNNNCINDSFTQLVDSSKDSFDKCEVLGHSAGDDDNESFVIKIVIAVVIYALVDLTLAVFCCLLL